MKRADWQRLGRFRFLLFVILLISAVFSDIHFAFAGPIGQFGVFGDAVVNLQGEITEATTGALLPQGQADVFVPENPQPLSSFAGYLGTQSGSAQGTAALGHLSGEVLARIIVNHVGVCCNPAVSSITTLQWVDTFQFTSSVLAAGTPVQYGLHVNLVSDANTTGSLDNTPPPHSQCCLDGAKASLQVNFGSILISAQNTFIDDGFPVDTGTQSDSAFTTITGRIGDVVTLSGNLSLNTGGFIFNQTGQLLALSTAAHSATFFVDPETPGASYLTASGDTYFTPVSAVPEPASLFLVGMGFAVLAGAASRRYRRK